MVTDSPHSSAEKTFADSPSPTPARKKAVVVLPSRGRPERLTKALDSVIKNSSPDLDIVVAIDQDEKDFYPRVEGVTYDIGPTPTTIGVNAKLNRLANKYKDSYDYFLWVADDSVILTKKWDKLLIKEISKIRHGISHPYETSQDVRKLPSNGTCFDLSIVRTLGYLAPPSLLHLYIDNFWQLIGTELGTLRYTPKVELDHQHFTNNKSVWDSQYAKTNSQQRYDRERDMYEIYKNHQLKIDLAKLRSTSFD